VSDALLVLRNIGLLATCNGPDGSAEVKLGLSRNAALVVRNGAIDFVGNDQDLPAAAATANTQEIDVEGAFVGPGLVDPHTHAVFAGNRSNEFELRCQGISYLDIAKSGGGILKTVEATRQASEATLTAGALERLRRLLAHGVTSVEVKTGYGLDLDTEMKMLRVIQALQALQPVTLFPTLMALHAVPPEYASNRQGYLDTVAMPLLRQARSYAQRVDAFVEASAFSIDDVTPTLRQAQALGYDIHLHVDQLSAQEGAVFAARLGAAAASHLEQVSATGIAALRQHHTVAVLAPTSTLFARVRPYAPGRALIDAGVPVALCSNLNPGSSLSENVSLAIGLACLENGLTPAEAFLGFTRHAGLALRQPQLGRIQLHGPADVVIFKAESYRDIPYHLATSLVHRVFKSGVSVRF
jgi:imidazolonepropionase